LLQLNQVIESDSTSTEDLIAYNIIPIDATSSTNAIVFFTEVLELL
jgi:callose synthase